MRIGNAFLKLRASYNVAIIQGSLQELSGPAVRKYLNFSRPSWFFQIWSRNKQDTKAGTVKKDSPADVAQDGFDAMMAGKDHVIGGSFKNSIQDSIAKFIPETLAASIQGKKIQPEQTGRH
jgi:hypothetical protein